MAKTKIAVLVSGGGTNLQALIDAQGKVLNSGEITLVVSNARGAYALERAAKADKAILFYENERATTLRMAMEAGIHQTISLLTGPEGGLEAAEVEKARQAGLDICTLGKRILRCETAPLCALSAVMYDAGEF